MTTTAGQVAHPVEPLGERVFARERARLEELLAAIDVPVERRRPEEVLVPAQYRDPRMSFVARDPAGRVVGFVTAYPSPHMSEVVFVPWLSVDASTQGRGLGRALMAAVLRASYEAGFRFVSLYVQEEHTDALAFYDRLGGRRVTLMPPRDDETLRRGAQWVYVWPLPASAAGG